MYTTTELSTAAANLVPQLAAKGLKVSHAQALEMIAKAHGSRNLATYQAAQKKKRQETMDSLAHAHVTARMFLNTGTYEGTAVQYLQALRDAFAQGTSREIEAKIHALTEVPGSPVMRRQFTDVYRLEHLFDVYQDLLAAAKDLIAQTSASFVPDAVVPVVASWQDWTLMSGLPPEEGINPDQVYQVKLEQTAGSLGIVIAPAHNEPDELIQQPQLFVLVEINQGVPCVHVSGDVYGDMALTAFGTATGVLARFDEEATPVPSPTSDDTCLYMQVPVKWGTC